MCLNGRFSKIWSQFDFKKGIAVKGYRGTSWLYTLGIIGLLLKNKVRIVKDKFLSYFGCSCSQIIGS